MLMERSARHQNIRACYPRRLGHTRRMDTRSHPWALCVHEKVSGRADGCRGLTHIQAHTQATTASSSHPHLLMHHRACLYS